MIDDDFRNIFALSALLERGHADVVVAESGRRGARDPRAQLDDVDIVLIDIMMPVMDGYETMRAIRSIERFKTVADHRGDRQGRRRRTTALHRRGRERLRAQTRRPGRAPRRAPAVVADPCVGTPDESSETERMRPSVSQVKSG